ncbi:MAG: cell division protein FtsA [Patescibacteria group bacterium]
MARAQNFVGLDIGSGMIRVAVSEKKENNLLALVGVGESPADGVRKGAIVDPNATARSIQKAIGDLKKNYGVVVDHATISLSEPRMTTYVARGTVSVSRADGEVTREDVTRAIEASEASLPRLGNREVVHSFPLFFAVDRDTRIREPVGLIGAKLEVETLFVAAFTPHIKNIFKAMSIAGIEVDDLVAAPYGASFHALSKKQKEIGTLLLDIGAQITTLAVFEESMLVALEVIPYGSGHITYDIGLGFQIDQISAERVKRNLSVFLEQGKKEIRLADLPKNFEETFSPKKLREIVGARLGDIFELVEKHLRRIERSELLPGGIVLSGGGSKLFGIVEAARESLRLPVEIAQGTPGVIGKKELILGPEWMKAMGLMRHAAEQHIPEGRMNGIFASPFTRRISKILRAFIP